MRSGPSYLCPESHVPDFSSCPLGCFLRAARTSATAGPATTSPCWRISRIGWVRRCGGRLVNLSCASAQDRIDYGLADDVIHYLSSGGSLGSATFSNDGDVPTYPIWTVVGPTTAVSFSVEGSNIVVPFAIPDGYAVQIDMDPVNGQVLWYGPWDGEKATTPIDRTSNLSPA